MTGLFTIDLTINMPDGGRHARQLLNLYFSDMPADIDASALALCESNPSIQARKFSKLTVKRSDAWSNPEHSLKIFVLLSVYGEDQAFVRRVIDSYMQDFPGFLKKASAKYYARSSFPPEIPLEPTDWSAEIH